MKKYGLVGKSLAHSFSKQYFNQKFKQQKLDAVYENIELENVKNSLRKSIAEFVGVNVTIPYKEEVIAELDGLKGVAAEIGAVNTIKIENDKLIGYNTDVFGFQQMIKPFFKSNHERAIILGTGGASKAIAYSLISLGCDPIFISRTAEGENHFTYSEMNEQMFKSCHVIVNTTPIGTFPNITDQPAVPYQFLTEKHLAIDLIYNPPETVFLKLAKEQGAVILNGKTMLEQQAEEAWRIWNE